MDLQKQPFKTEIAGKELTLEISKIAEQANAAVMGHYGDTSVLVTATMGKEDRQINYFPLVIDYEEKFYAAGKIIGSRFIRREGRPSEEAVLSGRLIDRSLRPLFGKRLRRDVQIIITVLSYDEESDPDFVSLVAASTAIGISNIPWGGPIGGLKVAKLKDGKTVLNPGNSIIKESGNLAFEGFVAGAGDKINMIELSGNEAGENDIIESFALAREEIKKLIDFQKEIIKKIGTEKIALKDAEAVPELESKIRKFLSGKLEEAVYVNEKTDRQNKLGILKEELHTHLIEEGFASSDFGKAGELLEEVVSEVIRKNILEKERRPDGRKIDEIRPLYAEVALFKRLHGSALFIRGNTQALAATTLAAPGAEQLIETMEVTAKRRFMLHYNFPPYSVGEISRLGSPGRREIGHGALVEKALRPIIPTQDEFPYTVRVVSEILSSNGSSSMASVCSASLALMDAGVPIKKPVGGIAMGLVTEPKGNYKILTDLQGPEDHYGDMDFKVAGTTQGITAIQLDVKIEGLTAEMIEKTLEQAKKARLEILNFTNGVLAKPREKVSPYAPVIMTLNIKPEQIGEVIGPAGKIINGIIAETGVLSIDIEQTGKVFVAASDDLKAKAAIQYIKSLTREFQVGEIIEGKVIKILDFGAIVDLGGGKDGMIHVSELKEGFVQKVEDVVRINDLVKAKIIRVENGKVGLSLRGVNK